MAGITLKHIVKQYPGAKEPSVKDFDLEITDKEFMVLVGPSGCGKSTTLRMIAGLEDISGGELYIGDRLVNAVEPKDRDIAMVFQNYALYPHMTVYKNMAYGLQIRKTPKEEIDKKVREAAKLLELEPYLNRKPKALSGGQRQRVALGRAMVREPAVFLLDEPLSNLDAKLRTQMRTVIARLHRQLGTTFVYVTHDQTEAMTMGDRIVVMKDGIIQQVDTPQKLYDAPCNQFVAGFIGSPQMNFLNVTLEERGGNYAAVAGDTVITIPAARASGERLKAYVGKSCVLGIRPEHIHGEEAWFKEEGSTAVEVKVDFMELMGAEIYLYFELCGSSMVARIPPTIEVRSGDTLRLALDGMKLHLFDGETQASILYEEDK